MNNACLIYEDTFISLLNLIAYLVQSKIKPANIKNTKYSPTLLDNIIKLEIEENENIVKTMIESIGNAPFRLMYLVFLSTVENKELILYYFYLKALKYKEKIFYHRNLKCVDKAIKIANYVSHESHKYKGFVRFKDLKNHILYAEIEPANDILEIITPHFKTRLKNEYWIIKDVKRKIVAIYDKKKVFFCLEEEFTLKTTLESQTEMEFSELWKIFYKTIGIKDRKNERCRMNFMPKRFWKYMKELEDEL